MGTGTVFGVEIVKQRFVDKKGVMIYASISPDEIKKAVSDGHLVPTYRKDGKQVFEVEEVNRFMTGGQPPVPRKKRGDDFDSAN